MRASALRRNKKVTQHLDREQQALADRRLGATPEERLRWVVNEFLVANLDDLLREERTVLGYVLRQLTPPVGWAVQRRGEPLPDEDLRTLQRRLRKGLEALVKDRRDLHDALNDRSVGWRLPLPQGDRLVRTSAVGAKPATFMLVAEAKSEVDAAIRAVADLVLRAGRQLRACQLAECTRPFIARRKAQFCGIEHAQRFRNLKRLQRRKRTE